MKVMSKTQFINEAEFAVGAEDFNDKEYAETEAEYAEYLEAIKTELRALLMQTIVEVQFTKADGSQRTMLATLNNYIIESRIPPIEIDPTAPIKERKENPNTQRVLDTEINEFRAFNWDRLNSYEVKAD